MSHYKSEAHPYLLLLLEDNKLSFTVSFNDMKINNTGEVVNENEIMIKNGRGEMKLTRAKS